MLEAGHLDKPVPFRTAPAGKCRHVVDVLAQPFEDIARQQSLLDR